MKEGRKKERKNKTKQNKTKQTNQPTKKNITNSMKQSFSAEANISSCRQNISCILWNLEVPCHISNNPPLVLTLNQKNPVHAFLF
jgi:hypothetical protein